MEILLLNGSPKKDGNTFYLLNEIAKQLETKKANVIIESVHDAVITAKTPFCLDCSKPCNQSCYRGTKLEELFLKMESSDAIIFGSPVYFGNVTSQLKVLFDKSRILRNKKSLVGKPGGVVTVGASKYGGQELTAQSLINMLMVQGMTVFNEGFITGDAGHSGVLAHKPACEDSNVVSKIESFSHRAYMEAKRYELGK